MKVDPKSKQPMAKNMDSITVFILLRLPLKRGSSTRCKLGIVFTVDILLCPSLVN